MVNYYDNRNKVTQTALCVRYCVSWNEDEGSFTVTRTAQKTYSFVGMTRATAMTCATAKTAQYTREHKLVGSVCKRCDASIVPHHDGGGNYSVNISVNEIDVVRVSSAPTDPSSYFSTANATNYDETVTQLLTATGVTVSATTTTITFTTGFVYEVGTIGVQNKTSASQSSWSDTYVSESYAGRIVIDYAYQSGTVFRLTYGDIVSNAIGVE